MADRRIGALGAVLLLAACGGSGRAGGTADPGPAPPPQTPPASNPPPTGGSSAPPARLEVSFTGTEFRFLGIGADGTAYATNLSGPRQIHASADGRTWTPRGPTPGGRGVRVFAALSGGALLADTADATGHVIARSGDGGRTWTDVLWLGGYRMLTPGSVAELGGETFLLEYQSFTGDSVPIRLWASADGGLTWSVRAETSEHRHGHGLLADPATGALWLFYGDRVGGTYLSFDGGRTQALVRGPLEGGVLVRAVATPEGLLGGIDSPFTLVVPHVITLSFGGAYEAGFRLPGPSYSALALRGGGYLVGAAREPAGDVYPDGDVSAHLFASADGAAFDEVFACARLSPDATARADANWQLASGEVVVDVLNCEGFGPGGAGYVLLAPSAGP
ncbi:glycosyl hydrolase, BNR repeat protein [Anaeromyxobacter dehalogenans 2CP-1]|uniref:Glycosyl hydrolase, BNR repeat protein n=1 Tax=Anaeromyxobacter dehalogenans (strain ATCC BAA-258 / DSM 21875 / 2CP-1) TaxID=455488 RepID=B8J5I7_ANAD2|nr:sialidase family protein [Anaeromyxobacter dehalogenans]ACL66849.1 glycosyl hydrolase, BNR repeat protein [Anaeromyxobacter dehalogenans 2CP-1]